MMKGISRSTLYTLDLLKRGDEVNAIKIFEELFLPFDRMAKFYEKLAGKKERRLEKPRREDE